MIKPIKILVNTLAGRTAPASSRQDSTITDQQDVAAEKQDQSAAVGVLENFDYNHQMWNLYAEWWSKEKVVVEDATINTEEDRQQRLKYLGDEWGIASDVEEVLNEYVFPFVKGSDVVGEIGSGGGRIASRLVEKCKELYCFDISEQMLKRVSAALSNHSNVNYVLLQDSGIPVELKEKFDFIYSFDVFVHLDLHNIWKYFRSFPNVLKTGGKVFVHTTNLTAPAGWERFAEQEKYSIHGHYFVTPQIVKTLAERAGLKLVKESIPQASNFYLARDYLAVFEKV